MSNPITTTRSGRSLTSWLLSMTLAVSLVHSPAQAQGQYPPDQDPPDQMQFQQQQGPPQQGPANFSSDQLDQMLGPIALYPDPLLAQVLPACAYPQEIDQAAHFVQANGPEGIDSQPWDNVVRAVAHYPDVMTMLDQNLDWTAAVGQAFAYQMGDVTNSIQRLRQEAYNAGSLQNTPQEQIVQQGAYITIAPTNPDAVYVPIYNPEMVYSGEPAGYNYGPAISFSAGVGGAWLNFGMDWQGGSVVAYPAGVFWGRGGWERGHGQLNNVSYIHNTFNYGNRNRYHVNQQHFAAARLPASHYAAQGIQPNGRGNLPNARAATPAWHPVQSQVQGGRGNFPTNNNQGQRNPGQVRNNNANQGQNQIRSMQLPSNQPRNPNMNPNNQQQNRPVQQQQVRQQVQQPTQQPVQHWITPQSQPERQQQVQQPQQMQQQVRPQQQQQVQPRPAQQQQPQRPAQQQQQRPSTPPNHPHDEKDQH